MLGNGNVAVVDDRTGQGIGVMFVSGSNVGIGIVKATNENTWDDKVATTTDGIEDSVEGGATVGVGENVVARHLQLTLDVTGGHQSGSDTGGAIREGMLMTAVGVGRYLKITVANGAMDVAVSCAKDDITAFLGVVSTVGMEELKLVSGSGLGPLSRWARTSKGSGL